MSGTRAIFASIGASVLLVAAAALSLLAVSAVFAFGGWSDPVADSARQSALVLERDAGAARQTADAAPVVLRQRSARSEARRSAGGSSPSVRPVSQAGLQRSSEASRRAGTSASAPQADPPAAHSAPTPSAPAATPKQTAGDGVRSVGEDLTGTVQGTGTAVAQVTEPLAPPISTAVQEAFNLVAALLRKTTNAVGGAVDGLLAK